jgi:hypothetical protein
MPKATNDPPAGQEDDPHSSDWEKVKNCRGKKAKAKDKDKGKVQSRDSSRDTDGGRGSDKGRDEGRDRGRDESCDKGRDKGRDEGREGRDEGRDKGRRLTHQSPKESAVNSPRTNSLGGKRNWVTDSDSDGQTDPQKTPTRELQGPPPPLRRHAAAEVIDHPRSRTRWRLHG